MPVHRNRRCASLFPGYGWPPTLSLRWHLQPSLSAAGLVASTWWRQSVGPSFEDQTDSELEEDALGNVVALTKGLDLKTMEAIKPFLVGVVRSQLPGHLPFPYWAEPVEFPHRQLGRVR